MRTPEEKAADAQLDAAIGAVMSAYGHTGLAVGHVLIVDVVEYLGDGQHSGVCRYTPEDQRWTQTIGIIETGRMQLRATWTDSLDGDE